MPPAVRRAFEPPWVDPLAAVTCFAAGALLYAADQAGDGVTGRGPDPLPLWFRLALLAVACAGQALRRRAPVPALAIVSAALVLDATQGMRLPVLVIILADVVYAATAFGTRWLSRLLVRGVVLLSLGLVALAWFAADSWREAVWFTFQIVVVLPTPVWWGAGIRHHSEIAAAERSRAEGVARLAELDRRAAVAAERQRMARDLHDVVAGHLSAIALQSEAVLSGVRAGDRAGDRGGDGAGDGAGERAVMRAVRENSLQALAEMRRMIDLLRSDDPADGAHRAADGAHAPRLSGMDRLVSSARAAGLRVDVAGTPPPDLPPAVDAAAYRILQEALTNAAAHAPRSGTLVCVAAAEGRLVLEVSNDLPRAPVPAAGRGTPDTRPAPRTGTGLTSMRTRAEEVGGTLAAGPVEGRWRVLAELPA
jgi:signal transduction histidine kinase